MTPERPRLEGLNSGARRLSAHGGGYSHFVRVAKLALPIAAVIIVGIVIARLKEDSWQQQVTQIAPEEKAAPGQIELIEAKYEGRDEKGQPYTVTADKATRASDSENVIRLENPKADIALESGDWLAVHADKGIYNNGKSSLRLTGNVTVFHNEGYELHMSVADLDLATRRMTSPRPVKGQGPMGSVTGSTLEVTNGGALVVFGGPATLTLNRLSSGSKAGNKAGNRG